MSYNSKYTGQEVEELLDKVDSLENYDDKNIKEEINNLKESISNISGGGFIWNDVQ